MRYLFTLLIVVAANSCIIAQDKWGLRRSVEYAWQNNLNIKQQEIQAALAGVTEKQARNSVYPNANFSTNAGVQFGRSVDPTTNQFTTTQLLFQQYSLNTDITIFNWHRVKNSTRAAQLDTKAAIANVEKTKNDIALSVATQYLQALLNTEQVAIVQVQFEQTKSQLQATRLRVNAGALPELNATELEAQLARDSTAIINAKAIADISVLQLKALLNLDAAAPFELDIPPVEKIPLEKLADLQPDYVYQMALQNQPAQKVNMLRLQSSQMNVKVAKASLYPVISAFAGLGSNFANPFKKVTNVSFAGYGNPDPTTGAVTINNTQYFLQQPQFNVTQGQKSFGELWKGYGTQVEQNFRQNIGFSIFVPIFSNGGAARAAHERSKLNVKSAEITIQQADQQLKQDIYQSYTNALSALERFNATEVTVAASQKTYDFSLKRFDVGLLGTFELLINQNNLTTAKLNRLVAQYEYVFRMKVLEFYKGQGLKL
ncbi:MAG TPA: TolC family protein [Ferruginibacter sp.]|nr:TolC family protein [Ferruginibacter sp.]